MTDVQHLLDRLEAQAVKIAALEEQLLHYKHRNPVGWFYRAKGELLWDFTTSKRAMRALKREHGPHIVFKPHYPR